MSYYIPFVSIHRSNSFYTWKDNRLGAGLNAKITPAEPWVEIKNIFVIRNSAPSNASGSSPLPLAVTKIQRPDEIV